MSPPDGNPRVWTTGVDRARSSHRQRHYVSQRQRSGCLAGAGSSPTLHWGKDQAAGISKRGNEYLRRMFLHGARSVVAQIERNRTALGMWLTELSARTHRNVTVVALANKMARTAWALLSRGTATARQLR